MPLVVCVFFCACCTWCSGLDDIFQMCGLVGHISSSAKEDQMGCVSCTISFQGNHVCVWVRFRALTDILAGGKRRSNIRVVLWGQGLLEEMDATFGALATRLSAPHHMHSSLRFWSLPLSSRVGSIWPCFILSYSIAWKHSGIIFWNTLAVSIKQFNLIPVTYITNGLWEICFYLNLHFCLTPITVASLRSCQRPHYCKEIDCVGRSWWILVEAFNQKQREVCCHCSVCTFTCTFTHTHVCHPQETETTGWAGPEEQHPRVLLFTLLWQSN